MTEVVDADNTKMSIEIEKGKTKTGKEWKGVRVRIGNFTRVIFPYPKQMEYVESVIDANRKEK